MIPWVICCDLSNQRSFGHYDHESQMELGMGARAAAIERLGRRIRAVFYCIEEVDVPAQTTVRAEYESPDTTDVMVSTGVEYLIGLNSRGLISCVNGQKTVLTIYSLDLGDDALVDEATGLKGSKSFTAQQSGIYWVCVSLDSSNYALPDDASMRFTLKLVMGTSQEEYQNLAKKNQMDDLHLKILQLRDRVTAIQRNQDYAKVRKKLSDAIINRKQQPACYVGFPATGEQSPVRYVTIFLLTRYRCVQIATLLITGFYQAKHLKAYLYKKKLV
uniref:GOLD domain-containing protein n=1 Tax=Hyaloperonospora arabidopsidis (strain Emoy2) TaxID=559515 RepID=M4BX08_HYAAE